MMRLVLGESAKIHALSKIVALMPFAKHATTELSASVCPTTWETLIVTASHTSAWSIQIAQPLWHAGIGNVLILATVHQMQSASEEITGAFVGVVLAMRKTSMATVSRVSRGENFLTKFYF